MHNLLFHKRFKAEQSLRRLGMSPLCLKQLMKQNLALIDHFKLSFLKIILGKEGNEL